MNTCILSNAARGMSNHPHRWLGIRLFSVAVLLFIVLSTVSCISPQKDCISNAPDLPFSFKDFSLQSVSMFSHTDGWIAGGGIHGNDATLFHYDGLRWKSLATAGLRIYGININPANGGMAVGKDDLFINYKDGCWEDAPPLGIFPMKLNGPQPLAVASTSADTAWAAGEFGLLHYSNNTWSKVALPQSVPTDTVLSGISMLSETSGWAVGGSHLANQAIILQYKDGAWVKEADPASDALHSVFMLSSNEGWAVGAGGEVLHYLNGQWQVVATLPATSLNGIYMLSATDGWAVGEGLDHEGIIFHWSGGQWQQVNIPKVSALHGVAMISTTEGWAVGDNGAILHYQNGNWQQWQQ